MEHVISGVEPGSIAEELGICPGDTLLSINGRVVRDLIDYEFLAGDEHLLLTLRGANGEEYEAEIEKDADEDLGLSLEHEGLGKKRVCRNKCVFCFVDQLPKGMRKSLYLKDDDWRLSFFMGNYITLTNLSEGEVERIIEQKLGPLYVSVHATDDAVRAQLLGCKAAKHSFALLERLAKNGITLHTQVVLCPGINDGGVLERTLDDLFALYPGVASIAVVPVGLTGHRQNCAQLRPVDKEAAACAIDLIEDKQGWFMAESGTRFAFAADELYIRAGRELPPYEDYEEFSQIENGVGLMAKLLRESGEALALYADKKPVQKRFGIVTGMDAAPYLRQIVKTVERVTGQKITIYPVRNEFFGESVTVTGLLVGNDIIRQLSGKTDEGDILLFSAASFREGEDVTLDDVSLTELEAALGCECRIVVPDGFELIAQFFEGE